MNSLKKLLILILAAVSVFVLVSCGDKSTSNDQTTVETTVEVIPAPETQVQTVPEADTEVGSEIFIGNWKDIESEESFANITKTDAGFTYEDNDGKYSAMFQDGVLKVQVSDTEGDTASA